MAAYDGFVGARAGFADRAFFRLEGVDAGEGGAWGALEGRGAQLRWEGGVDLDLDLGGVEGGGFVEGGFENGGLGDGIVSPMLSTTPSPTPSPTPTPTPSPALDDSAVSLASSLDDVGIAILDNSINAAPAFSTANYTPNPHILAHQPASLPDLNALYAPLTTSHFRTSAEAKAHRKRARLPPKSQASDVARVKTFGRDYWVCRIFNAMIHSRDIADSGSSIHRSRFTARAAFDALDLEAAAHHVLDEAIAVHERGWNRPKVYHKNTVRGKLVDVSETSLELRLSRICLVLQQTKSAVDDAVRGGVTLALLCDNPEARRGTKVSNDAGNAKRGERLKQTATKERAKKTQGVDEVAEVESQEQVVRTDAQDVSAVQKKE